MWFTGNPGTGKTSIARVIGKIFEEENILSGSGDFVEIHGRDLVEKYVGWTAQKVHDTIERAIGGVLFIDEAYSLVSDRRNFPDYNEEELLEIFNGLCKKEKHKLSETCKETLINNFRKAKREKIWKWKICKKPIWKS